MGILFLSVNLITFSALMFKRYGRLYPIFMVAMALTTWQAAVRLAFGENRAWWTPGESLLLLATAAAALEAVFDLRPMRPRWRWMVAAGFASTAAGIALWLGGWPGADPWKNFFASRIDLFLGLGVAAFAGALYRLLWKSWPRVGRLHGWLYAALMIGHASLLSWDHWGEVNLHYRWLEMTCCGGWLINLRLLGAERIESEQKALRAWLHSRHGHSPSRDAFPAHPLRAR